MSRSESPQPRYVRSTAGVVVMGMLAGCAGQGAPVPASPAASTPVEAVSAEVTPSASATPTVGPLDDHTGMIAYTLGSDVVVMSPAGGPVTALAETPATEIQFTWSPDGKAAIFSSNQHDFADLELFMTDASGVRQLTDGPGEVLGASWSPDGKQIVYGREGVGEFMIHIMGIDGEEDRELVRESNAWVGNPQWGPDGETIIFGLDRGGGGQIDTHRINVDGSGLIRLTDVPGDDSGARWSRDGSQIVFWSDREGGGIYLMDPDGANQRRIHADELHLDTAAIAWSPDDEQLVWTGKYEGGGGSEVFVMNSDGTDLRQIADKLAGRSSVDWHPGSE